MPVINSSEIQIAHSNLSARQRQCLRQERCLSDDIIDRYLIGVTAKYDTQRVTIPIENSAGEYEDVRCWLHPKRRDGGAPKILHWGKGFGGARLFPIDMLQHQELILVAGELDALAMISHGFNAFTVTAGESTWPDSLSEQIAAAGVKDVTILPDFDEPGLRGAEIRARSLSHSGLKVKVASWN